MNSPLHYTDLLLSSFHYQYLPVSSAAAQHRATRDSSVGNEHSRHLAPPISRIFEYLDCFLRLEVPDADGLVVPY